MVAVKRLMALLFARVRSAVFPRQQLVSRRSITCVADSAWRFDYLQGEAGLSIECHDSRRGVIRCDHRAGMLCQPMRQPHLVVPREASRGIVGKIGGIRQSVIGRVSIYEIVRLQLHRLEITAS